MSVAQYVVLFIGIAVAGFMSGAAQGGLSRRLGAKYRTFSGLMLTLGASMAVWVFAVSPFVLIVVVLS